MENQKTCYKCGALMKLSQRTGNYYCSALCWKNTEDKDDSEKGFTPAVQKVDSSEIIMEELIDFRREFNERMDSMAEWLAKNIK